MYKNWNAYSDDSLFYVYDNNLYNVSRYAFELQGVLGYNVNAFDENSSFFFPMCSSLINDNPITLLYYMFICMGTIYLCKVFVLFTDL